MKERNCSTSGSFSHDLNEKKIDFEIDFDTVHAPVCGRSSESVQPSQSYGRDRLLESAQFDSVTISCAADTVGTGYFFRCFFFFEMQNNSSRPKNEKSTAR